MKLKQLAHSILSMMANYGLLTTNEQPIGASEAETIIGIFPNCHPREALDLFAEIKKRLGDRFDAKTAATAMAAIDEAWDFNPRLSDGPTDVTAQILKMTELSDLWIPAKESVPSFDRDAFADMPLSMIESMLTIWRNQLYLIDQSDLRISIDGKSVKLNFDGNNDSAAYRHTAFMGDLINHIEEVMGAHETDEVREAEKFPDFSNYLKCLTILAKQVIDTNKVFPWSIIDLFAFTINQRVRDNGELDLEETMAVLSKICIELVFDGNISMEEGAIEEIKSPITEKYISVHRESMYD